MNLITIFLLQTQAQPQSRLRHSLRVSLHFFSSTLS